MVPIIATFILASVTTMTVAQNKRTFSTPEEVFVGTEWELGIFGQGNGTLKFEQGGHHVYGGGTCNSYRANYRVRGDRISFSQIVMTQEACNDGIARAQESVFFEALRTADRFRRTSQQLSIYYDAGRVFDFKKTNPAEPQAPLDDPIGALHDYYRSLNVGEVRRAYNYWENPSQTYDQFMHGFDDTLRVRLLVDPSPEIEGAAGSSYATVASIVISTQRNGDERVFAGCYVMRRSNVQSEDDPKPKGWRIYKASLAPISGKILPVMAQHCK